MKLKKYVHLFKKQKQTNFSEVLDTVGNYITGSVGRHDFFFFFLPVQREENSVFHTMEGMIVRWVESVTCSAWVVMELREVLGTVIFPNFQLKLDRRGAH